MSAIQDIFIRIQDAKKQQKDIRAMVKDALESKAGYRDIIEQMKDLRIKKNQIETQVKSDFSRELEKLDEIKTSLNEATAALSDAVLTLLAKGEVVKVRDAYNATYDPILKVSFKKSDEQGA